jgi:hypothetical protein
LDDLERFVARLSASRLIGTVNPYSAEDEVPELDRPGAAAIRRANLLDYLRSRQEPRLVLVGEAPGYRGCRFSGIPFTSERSLPSDRRSSLRTDGWREPSATIVHGVLSRLGIEDETVLWNVVPWHPTGNGPLTNRAPRANELRVGVARLAGEGLG